MNYKSSFGNSQDFYSPPHQLAYSNASRTFQRNLSPRNYPEDHANGMGELQFILENQRKKFREAKDRFEGELDNERKKRIEFENKLIKLKDEFSRREVALSEAEFKINNLLHQNQDIAVENDRLKNELARLEEIYGAKIHELETQLDMETKNFEETTLQYNEEFDKFKKEGQNYVQQLTFEMERKIKGLEERAKASEMAKRDLTAENKKLNDMLISNRLQFEEQIRDMKNRARDEEIKKAQYLTKSYEQKLKLVQDGKEPLARKIQELMRSIQDKESKLVEQERRYDDDINKIDQDRTDLHEQNNQLNYIINKLKMELSEKDSLIGRSLNSNDGELKMLKQQLEGKKQENSQLQGSIREMREVLKNQELESERKLGQVTKHCYYLQKEVQRGKEEYATLTNMLKSKINNTIDNVSYKK